MTSLYSLNEKLKTDLKGVNRFLDRVSDELMPLLRSKDDMFKIKLALEEAVVNAMRHGNKMDASRCVNVRIEADARKLTVDVHDQGDGFDFRVLPDPTRGPRAHQPSGRGVYLMRKVMNKVEFYDGGSGVKMTKTLHPLP